MVAPDTVLLVGLTRSFGSGDADAWAIEVTTSGQVLWSKTYGGPGNDVAQFVEMTPDAGFIVTGNTTTEVGTPQDILLMRLDKWGQLLWARRYGGTNTDVGMAVARTNEGGSSLQVGPTTSESVCTMCSF
jgi:hypothetical protein